MAKLNLTLASWNTQNVQMLPTRVKGQASNVKATHDKASLDILSFTNNTLIQEVGGANGSKYIGHNSQNFTSDNVGDSLEELFTEIQQIVLDGVPDGSITKPKLSVDLKNELEGKAGSDSPVFTGNPTAPTPADNDNDTSIATTQFVMRESNKKAPISSPTFTGTPSAPTPNDNDNTTKLATTAYVIRESNKKAPVNSPTFTGNVELPSTTLFLDETGSEGGQFGLSKSNSGSTLNGDRVLIDTALDLFRVFESGAPNRGAYLNISKCSNGIASVIPISTEWKTVILIPGGWSTNSFVPGYNRYYSIIDADFALGDVVEFEVGYGVNFADISTAENAGMANSVISGGSGGFFFCAGSVLASNINVKYRVNK